MALTGGLTIEFPDGREPVKMRFAVGDDDELILRSFSVEARALVESVQRVGGIPLQLNLSYHQDEGLSFTTIEPNDDQRAIILHRLRPMILSREPASFDRVCAIVRRSSDHEFLGTHMRRIREIYSGSDLRELLVVSRGEVVLNSEASFQNWLNGFEYHRDADRSAAIAEPEDLLPIQAVRPLFMAMLSEKLKAIVLLNQFVDKLLERPEPRPTAA